MTLRLLPWAVLAVAVAALAFLTPTLEVGGDASRQASEKGLAALEVRLEPLDLREIHDDGGWNRLVAAEAVYSYAEKTVKGTRVAISLGEEVRIGEVGQSVLRAPRAFWDLDGKRIELPDGGEADSAGGWSARLTSAVFDLDRRILRVPGNVSFSGPGLSVDGGNLRWDWLSGKIAMDSPVSRIRPSALPVKGG